MRPTVPNEDIRQIAEGDHHDPFQVLGMHAVWTPDGQGIAVRVFLPDAQSVCIQDIPAGRGRYPMSQIHPAGFFEAVMTDRQEHFPYRLEVTYPGRTVRQIHDPYAFPPVLSDYDLHLFAEGNHLRIYDSLGAHPTQIQGIKGVSFAVWAPDARRVSVVGDFNFWDGRRHPMRVRGSSGVWEIFIPELQEGALYKYEIKPRSGAPFVEGDPYAFRMEHRPRTASVVHQISDDLWSDGDWIASRTQTDPLKTPLLIYEVHLGSWRRVPEEDNRPLTYPILWTLFSGF